MTDQPKLSPIEDMKAASQFLRGTLAEELQNTEPGFSSDSQQLIKLHGLYQQKDRDKKKAEVAPAPVLMARGRIPGGRLTADQYLVWDRLADQFGDGTLRITTRQSIELHGIVKGDVKAVLQGLKAALLTTQNACGDVVRNVTQAVNPWNRGDLAQLDSVADLMSRHFLSRSNAYAEIWLDGEPVDPRTESEPLLGATYLPRKFKISLTIVGENLVDLLSNDLGFAATFDGKGRIDGYFVFAGGGQGMTHNDATTFPRIADLLGWIPENRLISVAEAVITTQRDFGNRAERKRARLKYLIANKGLEWFKSEVQHRSGAVFQDRELLPWRTSSYLGWIPRTDGTWALGFHTLSGRVADLPGRALKTGLKELVSNLRLDVQLTPDQDLLLLGIPDAAKNQVEALFQRHGIDPSSPSKLHDRALACVALPLCSLAITEAERALPNLLSEIQVLLDGYGLSDRAPVFRMTGCANGCARPYNAELALVGQGVDKYALYVGGNAEGTRLAIRLVDRVTREALPKLLDALFADWSRNGRKDEGFGDYAVRAGSEALLKILPVASPA